METARQVFQDGSRKSTSNEALRAAAVAAATTAGAAAARHFLEQRARSAQDPREVASRAASSVIDSAREQVEALAEQAAFALGRYLAHDAPELLRDRLLPAFIEAFQAEPPARSESSERESSAAAEAA